MRSAAIRFRLYRKTLRNTFQQHQSYNNNSNNNITSFILTTANTCNTYLSGVASVFFTLVVFSLYFSHDLSLNPGLLQLPYFSTTRNRDAKNKIF